MAKLHQKSAKKKPWQFVQHGDLWSKVENTVKANTPKTITHTKQKGHATQQMVDEGKVDADDKEGNRQSDRAADKGVVEEQKEVNCLGWSVCSKTEGIREAHGKDPRFHCRSP